VLKKWNGTKRPCNPGRVYLPIEQGDIVTLAAPLAQGQSWVEVELFGSCGWIPAVLSDGGARLEEVVEVEVAASDAEVESDDAEEFEEETDAGTRQWTTPNAAAEAAPEAAAPPAPARPLDSAPEAAPAPAPAPLPDSAPEVALARTPTRDVLREFAYRRTLHYLELSTWELHASGHYYAYYKGTELIWWTGATTGTTSTGELVEF